MRGFLPPINSQRRTNLSRAKWTTLLSRGALVCTALVLAILPVRGATLLTFEGLADLQPVGNFYTGVTFSNAVAAIAGKSVESDEFPPAFFTDNRAISGTAGSFPNEAISFH